MVNYLGQDDLVLIFIFASIPAIDNLPKCIFKSRHRKLFMFQAHTLRPILEDPAVFASALARRCCIGLKRRHNWGATWLAERLRSTEPARYTNFGVHEWALGITIDCNQHADNFEMDGLRYARPQRFASYEVRVNVITRFSPNAVEMTLYW